MRTLVYCTSQRLYCIYFWNIIWILIIIFQKDSNKCVKLLLCHDLETSTFQLKLKTSLYTLVASLLLACTGRASEIYEMLLRCTKQHTFLVQKQYNSYACDLSVLGVRMATNKSVRNSLSVKASGSHLHFSSRQNFTVIGSSMMHSVFPGL